MVPVTALPGASMAQNALLTTAWPLGEAIAATTLCYQLFCCGTRSPQQFISYISARRVRRILNNQTPRHLEEMPRKVWRRPRSTPWLGKWFSATAEMRVKIPELKKVRNFE